MARPFIPTPNCASVELIFLEAGEYMENTFRVMKGSPYTLAQLQALRGTVLTWEAASYRALRTSNQSLVRCRTKALDSLGAPMEDYSLPVAETGSGAATTLALNTAFCLKLSTGLTGRSFRGRWFAGGMFTSQLADAGHIGAVQAGQYVTALTALLNNLAAAGHTLVVVSYMVNKVWRAAGLPTPVTTIVAVDNNLDSQRRRLPGRGHSI